MGESLRHMGYDPKFAIADISDNCIDANADDIKICVTGANNQRDPVTQIDIFDNGCGMPGDEVNEALTLGSHSNKGSNALGCFGMGLKTAGTSLGRRLTVLSRATEGELACRVYDLDVNESKGMFVVEDRAPTPEERARFDSEISESGTGTWIAIDKIDKKPYANVKTMVSALRAQKSLRMLFRKFLDAEACSISVNGVPLRPWGYDYVPDVEVIADTFPFKLRDGTQLGTLKILCTLDTDHRPGSSRSQGMVVVRNNRDITPRPEWHGVHSFDWELNGVYVIWDVGASEFDSLMGTTVMKDSWALPQAVRDAMTQEISGDLRSYIKRRKALRKEKNKSDNTTVEDVAKSYNNNLNSNMNMTTKPIVRNEARTPPAERSSSETKETEAPKKKRKPFTYPGEGQDEWIIDIDPGCGDGRHFMVMTERKQRGGRRFRLSVDTNHPWVAKYFLSDLATNSPVMFMVYDSIVGDAYMELAEEDAAAADRMIRAKADFLRSRAKVTAAHDAPPEQAMAAK